METRKTQVGHVMKELVLLSLAGNLTKPLASLSTSSLAMKE